METIAILMPVRNGAKFISKALNSIINQTAFKKGIYDYRVIVVDNASTDNLKEVLSGFQKIEYLYCEELGVVAARNTGVFNIMSNNLYNYIAVLDCDDEWYEEKIELQFPLLLENKDLDICGTGMRFLKGEESFKVYYPETHLEIINAFNKGMNPIGHSSVMYRKKIFNKFAGYDETYRYCEDYDLFLRASKNYNLYNIPKILVDYYFEIKGEEYMKEQTLNTNKIFARTLINNGRATL
jgi:glycosyltransferase involved in cell wall biosynthesis